MPVAPNTQKISNKSAIQREADHKLTAVTGTTGDVVFVGFDDATTATTVGAAGGATAQPATPLGYIKILVNGQIVKIAYHNP